MVRTVQGLPQGSFSMPNTPACSPAVGSKTPQPKLGLFLLDGRQRHRPFVIGVCGGTASGKSTVCSMLVEQLGNDLAQVSSDAYYKTLNPDEIEKAHRCEYDFDSPDSVDFAACAADLKRLREWCDIECPMYDFATHSRLKETQRVEAKDIIMVEGILIFNDPGIRDLVDLKIFVDCDSDIRLARRVRRDIAERGRELHGVIQQYNRFVKPSYDNFVEPSKKYADIIIPNIGESVNKVAVDLIAEHVKLQMRARAGNLQNIAQRLQGRPAAVKDNLGRRMTADAVNTKQLSAAGLLVNYSLNGNAENSLMSSPRVEDTETEAGLKVDTKPVNAWDSNPPDISPPETPGLGKDEKVTSSGSDN
jgi:uridine kinase